MTHVLILDYYLYSKHSDITKTKTACFQFCWIAPFSKFFISQKSELRTSTVMQWNKNENILPLFQKNHVILGILKKINKEVKWSWLPLFISHILCKLTAACTHAKLSIKTRFWGKIWITEWLVFWHGWSKLYENFTDVNRKSNSTFKRNVFWRFFWIWIWIWITGNDSFIRAILHMTRETMS